MTTTRALRLAEEGRGPLLQRDYWAVIEGCRLDAAGVAAVIRERFEELPPPEIARFSRGRDGSLRVGDRMTVELRMAQTCEVAVLHMDRLSITLGTVGGHPEAGRITFGAYPNDDGDIVVHIRSRARAAGLTAAAGFGVIGNAMQTLCWTDYLNNLAATVGDGVRGLVHTETHEVESTEADAGGDAPTFVAREP